MTRVRWIVVVAGLALVLALANWQIAQKRAVIADGQVLLLELRPADPRSLIQGDYMALALAESAMPSVPVTESLPYRGAVILAVDENRVGRYARLDDGSPVQADELRVQYRRHQDWRGARLDYGAQAFFFQGGDAAVYEGARYAILRVAADGSTVLTDLAGEDRVAIEPSVD